MKQNTAGMYRCIPSSPGSGIIEKKSFSFLSTLTTALCLILEAESKGLYLVALRLIVKLESLPRQKEGSRRQRCP